MGLYLEGHNVGAADIASNTIKCALLTASYTPDVDHTGFSAVSSYELGTSGTGYTAGGATLSGKAEDVDTTNDLVHDEASDVDFGALDNGSIRYAVIYDSTDDKLIRYIDFATTRTLDGGNVAVRFTNGRFRTRDGASAGLYLVGQGIGTDDFVANTIKCALLTASYTPDVDHADYADISGFELSNSGTGYTTGGVTLTSKSESIDTTNDVVHDLADDLAFGNLSSGSIRYAVVYDSTDDKLIRYIDFTTTRTLNGSAVTLEFTNGRVRTRQAA